MATNDAARAGNLLMCLSCTIELITGLDLSTDEGHEAFEALGRVPWPDATKQMQEAAAYVHALYENPAGGTGGPLHVTTDDFNVGDNSLKFCRDHLDSWTGYDVDPAEEERARALGLWILDLLDPMTEIERSVTVALGHGEILVLAHSGQIFMPSTEFPIREDLLDDDGKTIGWRWGFRTREAGT